MKMARMGVAAGTMALWLTLLSPAQGEAQVQSWMLGLEMGQRQDKHLNGVNQTGLTGALSLSKVLDGSASRNSATLFPISGEMRFSTKGYMDFNAFLDWAVRASALTLGAGAAFAWGNVPDISDPTAVGSENVIVRLPMSLGASASAKIVFGPQGRAFIQGRFTRFPGHWSFYYKSDSTSSSQPSEDVTQRQSHTLRVGAGYVFSGKILRLQMIEESWRYDRIYDNQSGLYDRNTRQFAIAMIIFSG